MPYSHITRTAHGADAIKYVRGVDGKGHNHKNNRNEFVTGISMLPDNVVPFEKQMQPFWDKADPRHKIQINRYIISYSKKEVDPKDSIAVAKAHHVGCEIARFLSSGLDPNSDRDRALAKAIGCPVKQLEGKGKHQAMVATQTDGRGGCVHIHIAVNDVSMDTNRGLQSGLYLHAHLSKIVDYISEKYFDLDIPELAPEKEPQSVRGLKIKNEKIKKENTEETERAEREGREPVLQELKYIWIDDLKERIKDAAMNAEDEEEFFRQCRFRGVEVEKRKATKKQPAHYTFELTDISGFSDPTIIPKNLKRKSHKLGSNYQPENIAKMFKGKQKSSIDTSANEVNKTAAVDVSVVQETTVETEQKTQKEMEKEKEIERMKEAEEAAKAIVYRIFATNQGWEETPMETDEQGREWTNYDEISRRNRVVDVQWDMFKKWRAMQRKEGNKLLAIYKKDKTGIIFVDRDQVKQQFLAFLHPPAKEEKKPPKVEQREKKAETKEKTEVKHQNTRKSEGTKKNQKKTTGKAAEKRKWINRNREILLREMNEKEKDLQKL